MERRLRFSRSYGRIEPFAIDGRIDTGRPKYRPIPEKRFFLKIAPTCRIQPRCRVALVAPGDGASPDFKRTTRLRFVVTLAPDVRRSRCGNSPFYVPHVARIGGIADVRQGSAVVVDLYRAVQCNPDAVSCAQCHRTNICLDSRPRATNFVNNPGQNVIREDQGGGAPSSSSRCAVAA